VKYKERNNQIRIIPSVEIVLLNPNEQLIKIPNQFDLKILRVLLFCFLCLRISIERLQLVCHAFFVLITTMTTVSRLAVITAAGSAITAAAPVVSVPRAAAAVASVVAFVVMFSDFQIFNGDSILIFNGAATAVSTASVVSVASVASVAVVPVLG
jgi:hypothetical protein